MPHRMLVNCMRPYLGKWGKEFFKSMDLGIDGVYVPSSLIISFTLKPGYTLKRFKEKFETHLKSGECYDIVMLDLSEEDYRKIKEAEKKPKYHYTETYDDGSYY